MKVQAHNPNYSIQDIIMYRSLDWTDSKELLYLTEIPLQFEADFVKPDYYCFGMITQGELEINVNYTTYNLSPNSLLIYRPGQRWKVSKIAEGTVGTFILFTKKFMESLNENIFSVRSHSFLSQGIPSHIQLNDEDRLRIKGLFNDVFSMLHQLSKPNWELVARSLTSALIYETDNVLSHYIDVNDIPSNKEDELFIKFNQLLSEHFKTNRKPEFYASRLCVTSNYLYAVVKKLSGETPTGLINKQVIMEAAYQISYTLDSVAEIAANLNFCDPFTFSKYFKKNAGYCPSHYRKQKSSPLVSMKADM